MMVVLRTYNYYNMPIITTASLFTTQKHFDWAVQVLLAYKKHLQVDYSKAAFVPNATNHKVYYTIHSS